MAGIEGNINLIKCIYKIPTVNIILNSERLDAFSPKIRNNTKIPVLTTSSHHCARSSSRAMRQEKEKPLRLERKK